MKILYTDLNQIITLEKAFYKNGRHLIPEDLSIIPNGAIVFDEKILWVGSTSDIPKEYQNISATSLKNKILLPEIVAGLAALAATEAAVGVVAFAVAMSQVNQSTPGL